jgi:hypothetical protein
VDRSLVPQLENKELARSANGIGGLAYSYPERLTDETIETYFRPLVKSPLKKAQVCQYAASMETNLLVGIRENLRNWKVGANGMGIERQALWCGMGRLAE